MTVPEKITSYIKVLVHSKSDSSLLYGAVDEMSASYIEAANNIDFYKTYEPVEIAVAARVVLREWYGCAVGNFNKAVLEMGHLERLWRKREININKRWLTEFGQIVEDAWTDDEDLKKLYRSLWPKESTPRTL